MLDQKIAKGFIGREKEIDIFVKWLSDPSAPWILYLHDAAEEEEKKGGVGKTWLLGKCAALTRRQSHVVTNADFFNVADRDGISVAERVVRELQAIYPDWSPRSFKKALHDYRKHSADGRINVVEQRDRLADALVADLVSVHKRLAETDSYLLVFYDTFELIEHNPAIAVLRPRQTFPDGFGLDRIRAIVAGRNTLDWTHPNWVGRQEEITSVAISPFSRQEMVQYLEAECYACDFGSQPAKKIRALHKRTEGRPILLGLVADVLNHRLMTLDDLIAIRPSDFEPSLVAQVNHFKDPVAWAVLFMAHIYHRFNSDLLELIMSEPGLRDLVPEIEYHALASTLPTLSFVRQPSSGNDFVLHDEMRRLVNLHCWEKQDPAPDRRVRRELSLRALAYYEKVIAQERDEQLRQSYTAERLFHQLFVELAACRRENDRKATMHRI